MMKNRNLKILCNLIAVSIISLNCFAPYIEVSANDSLGMNQNETNNQDVAESDGADQAGVLQEEKIEENIKDESNSEKNIEKEGQEDTEESVLQPLEENSWRYTNGVRVNQESTKNLRLTGAWGKINGNYVNDKLEIINGAVAKGIDVSYHNGIIDWEKVKQSDVDYAILRCGYGDDIASQDDKMFVRNANECARLGIPFGVYIYSYAMNAQAAQSEANHVLRVIRNYNLDYPIFFDMENEKSPYDQSSLSKSTLGDIAQVFCDTIQDAGYDVGIYANRNWFMNILTDSRFKNWDKWVAQYNSNCTYPGTYTMWQSTDTGSVSGINGNVDLNFDFKYNIQDKSEWKTINGKKYYYVNGTAVKGEQFIEDNWYYFDENSGVMATEWVKHHGNQYYYGLDGKMVHGEKFVNGKWYYFNEIYGNMATGWTKHHGNQYYYESDGTIAYGEKFINGKWYYFNDIYGNMATDWTKHHGNQYYYESDGTMAHGEKLINGKWYYFDQVYGNMVTGWTKHHGNQYYYESDGIMAHGEKIINGKWYYFDQVYGNMATGWTKHHGNQYYYESDGQMVHGEKFINGKWYYFDQIYGNMATGWTKHHGNQYYYESDGAMVHGEKLINGKWYYFDKITGVLR